MNEVEDTSKKLEKPGIVKFYVVWDRAFYLLKEEGANVNKVIKDNLLFEGDTHKAVLYRCWHNIGCDLKDFFPIATPQHIRFTILKHITEKRIGDDYFVLLFVDPTY